MKNYIALLLLSISAICMAGDDRSKMIDTLGVQGSNAYFSVVGGLSTNCIYGTVYLDITTDFGKAAYANLLAAKSAGKPLNWINYTQGTNQACTLNLVEVK